MDPCWPVTGPLVSDKWGLSDSSKSEFQIVAGIRVLWHEDEKILESDPPMLGSLERYMLGDEPEED